MQYIHTKPGEIDWGIYENYIQSIRKKLPEHIYDFASNPNNFNFQSHSSLHDAWLESLILKEVATGQRNEIRKLEIEIFLLGPFHDRQIHLRYTGVTHYSFIAPPNYDSPRYGHTAHGDLFTHEIRLGHNGLIVHELLFESDAVLLIECSNIKHVEILIENPDSNFAKTTKHSL